MSESHEEPDPRVSEPMSASHEEPDPRVVDLEVLYAYQRKHLEELDELVARQARELELQEARITRLEQRVRELFESTGEALPHERPPHY